MAVSFKLSGIVQGSVTVDSTDGNEVGKVSYGGDTYGIRIELDGAFGAFGHRLNLEQTTPIDMDAALKSIKGLQVEITAGADLVASYDPKLPKGYVT